ncbi:MAG TPA: hypothetical protein DCZ13_11960 [Porticoccaceae bacterium]|nr:hypothetical protein [Porticoccaceae bacterium]
MNALGLGAIIEGVGKIADDLITSDEERLKVALQEKQIDAALIQGQLDVNKAEAQSASLFVAGARPFVIWVGGFSLAYAGIIYPLLLWVWSFFQVPGSPPPMIESDSLEVIMLGLLGVGGMRSFDKLKGKDTRRIKLK